MTKKLWFQVGVGLLLAILIIKYFMEISFIFSPVVIIVKAIILPLLLGGVLYYMTEPVQRFLEKRKVPRWGSIIIILVGLVLLIWLFLAIVGPPITKQVNLLVDNAPTITKELDDVKDKLLQEKNNLPDNLQESINSAANSLQSVAMKFGKWIVQFLQSFFQAMFLLILVPFFFIFMLKDHEKFAPIIYNFFSGERRIWIKKTMGDIDNVLRSYIQGQLLISIILATLIWIGYMVLGVQYSLLLAIFALFMNLIPFVGPWIAVTPALIIAYLQDPKLVIGVAIVTLVAQQIDSNLITPNVMGKTLDIHPLTVITIILAAGNIAGFLGIIVAIPVYAVAKVVIRNVYEQRKQIKSAATKDV
ncbi:AI-2E family transporter [Lederbergia galactosidilytica]|uniref:Lipoprotein n=1 Tax=Lederbergia galactosidilytica TaxID=217031 RepID=A0A178A4D2_9BACI|nr:AI-2E family transporter [Lederbergia galactosidilytica]KRG11145.1 lipoprotein [Virgibacillus soli]MBP1917500.1 putative PurR-regulated permease PerM [Lederbergia galactosidilytica]OAK75045.1 lipoprotein [Lederbergia galactosidilytica]